jgi:DNA repair photolyase
MLDKSQSITQNVIRFPGIVSPAVALRRERSLVPGPIETKMRRKLNSLKGTAYRDDFDWSIYDQIANKFGDKQPRGGVVFNTTLKLVNFHTSCSKCHYAFELDTYGRGCIHNCVFCYANDQLSHHGYWNRPHPFPVDVSELRKIFYTVFETQKRSKWRAVLEQRVPLRIGSMSDSFMWMDRKYGVTKEVLKILSFYRYPYVVFTRSDLIAQEEYMKLIDPKIASVQFSISGGNEQLTRVIEPGAPSVAKRLRALRTLSEGGVWTAVRLNPFFPTYPDGYYSNPASIRARFGSHLKVPKFELFDWSFLDEVKDSKVQTVLAGVVRLSGWAVNNMTKVTGVDFRSFFEPIEFTRPGPKRYSDAEVRYYYQRLYSECANRQLRFTTCYIGNGEKDYYQYQGLWTNKADCCDIVGNVSSFKTTSQSIPWGQRLKHTQYKDTAQKAKKQEEVIGEEFRTLSSVEKQTPSRSRLPELGP